MTTKELAEIPTIDVRTLPPYERHPRIFSVLAALKPGQSFAIVSDHEPRPLQYQIQARFPDLFDWTYVERGPQIWRVLISRAGSSCECCCGS